jgi:hypothetical protein
VWEEKKDQHFKYGALLRCCLEMAVKKGQSVNDKIPYLILQGELQF